MVVPVILSFLRAPAHPGVPGKRAVKWHVLLLLMFKSCIVKQKCIATHHTSVLRRCWLNVNKGIQTVKHRISNSEIKPS